MISEQQLKEIVAQSVKRVLVREAQPEQDEQEAPQKQEVDPAFAQTVDKARPNPSVEPDGTEQEEGQEDGRSRDRSEPTDFVPVPTAESLKMWSVDDLTEIVGMVRASPSFKNEGGPRQNIVTWFETLTTPQRALFGALLTAMAQILHDNKPPTEVVNAESFGIRASMGEEVDPANKSDFSAGSDDEKKEKKTDNLAPPIVVGESAEDNYRRRKALRI